MFYGGFAKQQATISSSRYWALRGKDAFSLEAHSLVGEADLQLLWSAYLMRSSILKAF